MRICTVYYGSHRKGCWKRLRYFLEELVCEGHEITLVTSLLPHDLLLPNRVEVIHISVFTRRDNKASLLYFIILASVHILVRESRQRYERFIAFDCHNAAAFFLSKVFYGTHLFVSVRGFYKHQDLFQSNYAIIRSLMTILNRVGYLSADTICFVSNANREDVVRELGLPNGCINIIMNNINNMLNCDKSISLAARSLPTELVVGYLGQIVPRKNVGFLISVIEQLNSPIIKLIIQGDGIDKFSLVDYVKKTGLCDRIIFKNWDSNVCKFFSAIDVFILPTYYDDASNALIEAIAAEKIIFASSRGGNIELLQNNPDLLFCPTQGKLDLCKRLERVSCDIEYRDYIIDHIRKCKEILQFDWLGEMKRAALIDSPY